MRTLLNVVSRALEWYLNKYRHLGLKKESEKWGTPKKIAEEINRLAKYKLDDIDSTDLADAQEVEAVLDSIKSLVYIEPKPTLTSRKKLEEYSIPSKYALYHEVKKTKFDLALVELVDNAIDHWKEEITAGTFDESNSLGIYVNFLEVGPEKNLVIKENSGGLFNEERDNLKKFLQLGGVKDLKKEGVSSIGAWGWGAKLGLHTCGRDIFIYSWPIGEKPFVLHYPPGFLVPPEDKDDDEDWSPEDWEKWAPDFSDIEKKDVKENSLKEGETVIQIMKPYEDIWQKLPLIQNTFKYFYAEHLKKNDSITITLNADETFEYNNNVLKDYGIEEQIKENCCFFPKLPPIHAKKELKVKDKGTLRVEAYVFHTPLGESKLFREKEEKEELTKGVYLFGNNRPFYEHLSLEERNPHNKKNFFWGKHGIPSWTSNAANHLHLVVKLYHEDSKEIPWEPPLKSRYTPEKNPYHGKLNGFLRGIAQAHAHLSSIWYTSLYKPWTLDWNNLELREKLELCAPPKFCESINENREEYINSKIDEGAEVFEKYKVKAKFLRLKDKDLDENAKGEYQHHGLFRKDDRTEFIKALRSCRNPHTRGDILNIWEQILK